MQINVYRPMPIGLGHYWPTVLKRNISDVDLEAYSSICKFNSEGYLTNKV